MDDVVIEGSEVRATSPEGQVATMPLQALVDYIAPAGSDVDAVVLPDGVKVVQRRGPVTVWVFEAAPRVYSFRWIRGDSPARHGKGTTYREVSIALPYLVVIAVFEPDGPHAVQLSRRNECFFRVKPFTGLDDELFYPALLNCSKFRQPQGRPLSWICTAKLARRGFASEADTPKRMRLGFRALLHCLLESGFNYSSEDNEGSSWFTESSKADRRISTVERWEQATRENPLFVLDVPWLPTKMSLGGVVERIFGNTRSHRRKITCARDIARLVFNHNRPRRWPLPFPHTPAFLAHIEGLTDESL